MRGEKVTGASKSTKNHQGCTIHRGGERFESAWLMTSGWGRCLPEAEGGRRAPVWSLEGGAEVARWAAIESSPQR
jgi:hypothetical protein